MTIPQIESIKNVQEPLHVKMLLPYPSQTPFGNFQRAQVELIYRIDYLNMHLQRLYEEYQTSTQGMNGFVPQEVLWFRFRIEEIVYGIRKTTDTLIALSCLLGENLQTGHFPLRLAIDCIGKMLRKLRSTGQPAHIELFRPHELTLKLINDVSNTYKHHFVNYETLTVIGQLEPTVYWLSMPKNDSRHSPSLTGILLSEFVVAFTRMLKEVRLAHEHWLSGGSLDGKRCSVGSH
jgi:hypothetical protein